MSIGFFDPPLVLLFSDLGKLRLLDLPFVSGKPNLGQKFGLSSLGSSDLWNSARIAGITALLLCVPCPFPIALAINFNFPFEIGVHLGVYTTSNEADQTDK